MDEYLFLVVAKLKADRRKLEREQRAQLHADVPQPPRPEVSPRDLRVRGLGKSLSKLEWREQS